MKTHDRLFASLVYRFTHRSRLSPVLQTAYESSTTLARKLQCSNRQDYRGHRVNSVLHYEVTRTVLKIGNRLKKRDEVLERNVNVANVQQQQNVVPLKNSKKGENKSSYHVMGKKKGGGTVTGKKKCNEDEIQNVFQNILNL